MTLILRKIELFNFRTHKYFLFSPDLEGITAILGNNGSGKSTIIDAFAWALYGTRPSKVTNKMLIRDGVEVKDHEVKAVVELTINKIDYRIVRRIVSQSGASDCNVYGRSNSNEYKALAGPAVTSAEAYIKQIMGMDEKGFLTAVLIQQKEVDQIVSSSPRERAAVIEKLTGISSITEAMDLAHLEMKSYQKAAGLITVDDGDSIKNEIQQIINNAKDLKTKSIKLSNLIKENKSKLDNQNNKLSLDIDNFNKANELSNKRDLIKQKEKMLNEELKRIMTALSDFKKKHNSSMIILDPKPLKEKHDSALRKYLKLNNDIERLKLNYEHSLDVIEKNKDFMSKSSDLETKQKLNEEKLLKLKTFAQELSDKHQIALSTKRQAKKSLSTISSGDMVCPICKRPIDNPEDLKKELSLELNTATQNEIDLKQEMQKAKNEIEVTNKEKQDLFDNKNLLAKLKDINANLPLQKSEIDDLSNKLLDLDSEVKILGKNYDKALKDFLYKTDLDNKKIRLDSINTELGNLDKNKSEIDNELNQIKALSTRELNAEKNTVSDLDKLINSQIIELNKNRSSYKYLGNRYKDLQSKYENAVNAKHKYDELVSQMKLSAVTGSIMGDFKLDRIKYAVPTIEMYASTFLGQFTDGKFSQLKLDGKFNTSVITSSGVQRPVAALSGGELSAAAIALRLSISMLLNGADKNVIILDEVLVSMDEIWARKIMETISTVTNSQIIFIAHNSDINSVADLVIPVGNKE